jgi:hypothetical protein
MGGHLADGEVRREVAVWVAWTWISQCIEPHAALLEESRRPDCPTMFAPCPVASLALVRSDSRDWRPRAQLSWTTCESSVGARGRSQRPRGARAARLARLTCVEVDRECSPLARGLGQVLEAGCGCQERPCRAPRQGR